ncbi:Uncharacterized protein Rs2_37065 [Raphanus sativus]|nr:Uncharacterized protein Rs2_37065 [Raphanus sativus]
MMIRQAAKKALGLSSDQSSRLENRLQLQALLEGVAIAGLVGLLRQLGDLVEWSWEGKTCLVMVCSSSLFLISVTLKMVVRLDAEAFLRWDSYDTSSSRIWVVKLGGAQELLHILGAAQELKSFFTEREKTVREIVSCGR